MIRFIAILILSTHIAFAAGYDVRITGTTGITSTSCAQTQAVNGTTYTFGGAATGACPTAGGGPAPAGRILSGRICYTYTTSGSTCTTADYTSFDQTFGRYWNQTPPAKIAPGIPFPGVNYYSVWTDLRGSGYVAVRMVIPATLSVDQTGIFYHAETLAGQNIDASISDAPGDFNPPLAICRRANVGPGGTAIKWKSANGNPAIVSCPLTPGSTVYFNFRPSSPASCPGTCAISLQHNHS